MNRARIAGGAGSGSVKNSLVPPMGKGKGLPKPVKNAIAAQAGAHKSSTVGNSLALCGHKKK